MGFVAFSLAAAVAPQAVRGADSIAWRSGVDGEWNDTAKWNLSRLPENPLRRPLREIVVAHYTGEAPYVSTWKATGHGLALVIGTCRAEGGDVILTLRTSGTTLIFR